MLYNLRYTREELGAAAKEATAVNVLSFDDRAGTSLDSPGAALHFFLQLYFIFFLFFVFYVVNKFLFKDFSVRHMKILLIGLLVSTVN